MTIITETPRLLIREFLPEEETKYVDMLCDTRVNAYLPKRTSDEMANMFRESLKHYTEGIRLTRWAIVSKTNGAFLGMGMLKADADDPYKAELGYVLNYEYHGLGYATELAQALVDYGFNEAGLREIFAVTDPENLPSQYVLLKTGLIQGENVKRYDMDLCFFELARSKKPV